MPRSGVVPARAGAGSGARGHPHARREPLIQAGLTICWPGGTRDGSSTGCPRPKKPREIGDIAFRVTAGEGARQVSLRPGLPLARSAKLGDVLGPDDTQLVLGARGAGGRRRVGADYACGVAAPGARFRRSREVSAGASLGKHTGRSAFGVRRRAPSHPRRAGGSAPSSELGIAWERALEPSSWLCPRCYRSPMPGSESSAAGSRSRRQPRTPPRRWSSTCSHRACGRPG